MTASGKGGQKVEGLRKKEKRVVDMDNNVVIAGGKWVLRALSGNGKRQ